MDKNYQILLKKLDDFIKKYYVNKIIKGLILAFSVYLFWYLIIVVAEYFGHFSTILRTILFFITGLLYITIFVRMLLFPVLNLFKIGKTLNHRQASRILGRYFPEVADKLQNTLELRELAESDSESSDIILASIDQRINKLSPVPFLTAINLKHNFKYLRFLAPLVFVVLVALLVWPSFFSEATERIINFTKHYETPAPFSFIILNDSLVVKKGSDFVLEVKAAGIYSPDQVLLNYGGSDYYMEKKSPGVFQYQFKSLNNDISFNFNAAGINSSDYKIKVLLAPTIIDFDVFVDAPAYTGVEDKIYTGSGDLNIPVGSVVHWTFNTLNLDELIVVFDSLKISAVKNEREFKLKRKVMNSSKYTIIVGNEFFDESIGINYEINVIPDLYPTIRVREVVDSAQLSIVYYNGFIDDDYGFTNLTFICKPGEKSDSLVRISIPFSKNISSQDFYFAFDFASLDTDGKHISYYFEVTDNDGVNGSKRSRTREMQFIIPSIDDLQNMSSETNKDTEEKIDQAKEVSSQIRQDIEDLQRKLINEQMTSYERNQMMQQIMNDQAKLEHLMNEISKEQSKLQEYKQQFSKNEELVKKQEEINQLMESMMDEEMMKLMEELQKLMEEFDKDEFFKIADDMKFSFEEMEEQMDNTLELLKKAEVEERLENTVEKLNDLAKEHEELSEQTKDKELPQNELEQKQAEHQKEFEEIKKDYEETLQKNSELEEPMDLDDFQEEMQEISEMMEQSKQELGEKKNSKASKSQQQSSQKMLEMSEQMQSMMDGQSAEQMQENMEDIQQVLENLITFSFDQEEILTQQKSLNIRDPRYKEYIIKQKNAQNNFDIIRDSLNAMAGRIPELGPLVSKEISQIYKNLNIVMNEIGENRRYLVESSQQLVMTSANNLALLLMEMMEQMQQQMSMQMSGEGQCNNCKNPGKGKPMGQMRDIQQGMKQQMQQMINQMKSGGKTPGGQNSEQLAKMLMQQEMMQQMLNDMMNSGISPESAKILQEINRMMDDNLNDIISGNVTQQTVNRQEQILTRLLQAENSEQEREIDQKRKSNEAKDYKLSNPDEAFKDKETEIRFNELLQMSNVKLKSYYKSKYKEYLKQLGTN
jgi:hypothetical protein